MLADNQTSIYQDASMLIKAGFWLRTYTPFALIYPHQRLAIKLRNIKQRIRSRLRSLLR
jgi:hypothetical protein